MSEEKFDINTDLRASMAETYDALDKGSAAEPSPVAPPSVEVKPDPSQAETKTPAEPEKDRARGPDGKFVKTEEEKRAEVKADGVIGKEESKDQSEAKPAPKGAPGSWSKTAQAHWDALPLEVKEAVLRRESEAGRFRSESGEKIKAYQELDKVLEPVGPLLSMQGLTKAQFVGNLVQAEAALRNPATKAQAFQYLAQSYGFDLNQLQPVQQQQVDPQYASLQQEIAQLKQERLSEVQQREQLVTREAETDIAKFAADPKNEFFEDVRPIMGQIIAAKLTDDLGEAYRLACIKHPEVSQIIEARRQDEIQKQLSSRAQSQASAVKKVAATNVKGSAGNSPMQVPSIRDGMSQVYDRIVNGA